VIWRPALGFRVPSSVKQLRMPSNAAVRSPAAESRKPEANESMSSTTRNPESFLPTISAIAREAGALLIQYFHQGLKIESRATPIW